MKFLDTNALLDKQELAFKSHFFISDITLKELEGIKTSKNKEEEIRYKARKIIKLLDKYEMNYTIINYQKKWDKFIIKSSTLTDNNDSRIILCAKWLQKIKDDNVVFVTNDIACRNLARNEGLEVEYSATEIMQEYKGYQILNWEHTVGESEYSKLYDTKTTNRHLNLNEYLLVYDSVENKYIDAFKQTEDGIIQVPYTKIESQYFGEIKPKDILQRCAFDSLKKEQFTILRGPAGSGKTMLALSYLFQEVEKGRLDKIIIACNPVASMNSAKMGYTPGSLRDKILDSQIGGILESKIGDRSEVERLIDEGTIVLIPFSNLRGFSCDGKVGFLVTEAQNLDVYLAKLAIQRCGADTKVIFEGDNYQTDLGIYSGVNNGLNRAIEIFKDHSMFSTITLDTIYRSELAELAQKM